MTAWPIHDWEELCGQAGEEMEQGSFLIDGLWPASGYVMLAAPSKAGKSTFVAHIIASLTTGTHFMAPEHQVKSAHRVCLIDTEMTASALVSYLEQATGIDEANLAVVTARARLTELDLFDPHERKGFAEQLEALNCDVLIFDCLSPYLEAHGINEDKEAGQAVIVIRELARLAGIPNLLIVHHTGHDGARARGSSSLLGSTDVNWLIKRSGESASAKRTFQAQGRGRIDTEAKEILFDAVSKGIRFSGAGDGDSTRADSIQEVAKRIFAAIRDNPGITASDLRKSVTGKTSTITEALAMFTDGRTFDVTDGGTATLTVRQAGRFKTYVLERV